MPGGITSHTLRVALPIVGTHPLHNATMSQSGRTYVVAGGIVVAVLVSLIFLMSRGNELSERQTETVVREVLAQYRNGEPGTSGDLSGIVEQQQPIGRVEVYVDRSLSMRPYVQARSEELFRLVGTLDDFIESQVELFGFGYAQRSDTVQRITPIRATTLRESSTYAYANNDYAALIGTFEHDGTTHLIVTDGVQSDPEEGARLASVAEALDRWVREGGTFGILFYRTAYRGQYYTDLGGPSPRYNCADRPFLVFVLAPSSRAIDDLVSLLGPSLRPDHEIRMSGSDLAIQPVEETPPPDGARRGVRVVPSIAPMFVEGYRSIYRITVRDAVADERGGFVPVPFDVSLDLEARPWTTLGEAGARQFLQNLEPRLHAWSLDPRAMSDTTGAAAARAALTAVDVSQQPASLTFGADDPAGTLTARYVVPVRRPDDDGRQYVFLLALFPNGANARALVPASYSTDDDRDPSQCSRILKLQRLVGGIMLRNYAPGQALLLAEWR